jgi:glucose/arabinose dehydrogenase
MRTASMSCQSATRMVVVCGLLACSSCGLKKTGTGGTTGPGGVGVAGATGAAGTIGNAGSTGSSGMIGSAGTIGNAGISGAAGASGRGGTTGSNAGISGTAGGGGRGGTIGGAGGSGTAGTSGGGGGTTGKAGGSGTAGAGGRGGTTGGAGGSGTAGVGGASTMANTCASVPASAVMTAWTADNHFCLIRYATGLPQARQLAFAPNGDLFVGGNGSITVLYDTDGNGISEASERSTFAMVTGGNHSVAVTATHVYASSDTTVFRWKYTSGQRTSTDSPEIVVRDMSVGGHATRTLLFDGQNRLYVSNGSASNVDAPSDPNTPPAARAQIRRYDLTAMPSGGYAATDGELFASGLRNEVGLAMDSRGRIWGVENGRDNLVVGGSDIHYDNPGEEVNLFDPARPGRNYGYPFCWSEGLWTGAVAKGTGTQHLDPDQPGAFTEARCQDSSVIVPPAITMRAHLAPLDIVEYTGTAYPAEFRGDLFVASHGSWNRETGQVGRLIVRLRMGSSGPVSADNFLGESVNGALREGQWSVRPVSIEVDPAGLLTFSDDSSGTINKIGYRP